MLDRTLCCCVAALLKGAMGSTLEARTSCCQRCQATSASRQAWLPAKAREGMKKSLLASASGQATPLQLSSTCHLLDLNGSLGPLALNCNAMHYIVPVNKRCAFLCPGTVVKTLTCCLLSLQVHQREPDRQGHEGQHIPPPRRAGDSRKRFSCE